MLSRENFENIDIQSNNYETNIYEYVREVCEKILMFIAITTKKMRLVRGVRGRVPPEF